MSNEELEVVPLNSMVLGILRKHHEWLTPYEIRDKIINARGRWVSDSTITSRIRDLRLKRYGEHQIVKRRLPHSTTREYKLVGK
jgi:hypothetical protein